MKYMVTWVTRIDLNLPKRDGSMEFDIDTEARDFYGSLFRNPNICEAELIELQQIGRFQR
jgi:hypothetical protein